MASDDILKNCIVTHKDSKVTRWYTFDTNANSYHLGVDIEASEVYCPCPGSVIYVGSIEGYQSCTVQYSANICLRFMHLKEVAVGMGDIVEVNSLVGKADKYVHFEYLTSEQTYPNFRVLFNGETSYYMYKHDPNLVLSGNVQFQRIDNSNELSDEDFEDLKQVSYLNLVRDSSDDFFDEDDDLDYMLQNSDLFSNLE